MNKKLLISLLFILLTGWIAACAYWSVFKINKISEISLLNSYESASIIVKEKLQESAKSQITTNIKPVITKKVVEIVETENNIDFDLIRRVKEKQVMYYPSNHFEVKSTHSLEEYFNSLKQYFYQNPEGLVQITGFTNQTSDASLSKLQSEKYAEKVKKHLIAEYEMNPRNFRIKGKGHSKLVSSSETESGKVKNRRIEFSFIK